MFNLLNSILERLADAVKPFLGLILQILPSLWEQSSGMTLLRIQVLKFHTFSVGISQGLCLVANNVLFKVTIGCFVVTPDSLKLEIMNGSRVCQTYIYIRKTFSRSLPQALSESWKRHSHWTPIAVQILLSIQRIVNSLGMECPSTYPLVIPILQQCTDPEQVIDKSKIRLSISYLHEALLNVPSLHPAFQVQDVCQRIQDSTIQHLKLLVQLTKQLRWLQQGSDASLLEDGLQLWLVTLRNAPAASAELLGIFPNLAAAMNNSTGVIWKSPGAFDLKEGRTILIKSSLLAVLFWHLQFSHDRIAVEFV